MKSRSLRIQHESFVGQHCETTATGNLLYHHGVKLSEPMMFGIGEGLGFVFLNLQSLHLPFVGGRSKPFELTTALCDNLGLKLEQKETSSRTKAWANVQQALNEGLPVGLQLDSYHLPYFTSKIHFAGHSVACIGVNDDIATLVDTKQQGGVHEVSLGDLEKARFEKGPMSAKARSWTIEGSSKKIDLSKSVAKAIRNNAKSYLKPPFKGASYLGIQKLAKSLPSWLEIAKTPEDLLLASLLMERAGTGGSIFRCFYRDFLNESSQILISKVLKPCCNNFEGIADDWKTVASLIEEAGKKGTRASLTTAAAVCESLAKREQETMRMLAQI